MSRLNPCPQCGATANRLVTDYGVHRFTEVIQCSVGCGYPWRIHPHICSVWMADAGWADLADMWNSCRIEKDPITSSVSLCWEMGPNYRAKPEIVGPFIEWSPEISAKRIAERVTIIQTGATQ